MKPLAVGFLALGLLASLTGCEKSAEWKQNKADCIAYWGDYRSPEELDAKCAKDADQWEKTGRPEGLPRS